MSLKRRALKRSKTLIRDSETQQIIPPSRISVISQKLKAPFTRDFWEERLEQTGGENLVDGKLLSYAYLEAGIIEMLGSWVLECVRFVYRLTTCRLTLKLGSLVAYFVVFFKNGFSPSDLRTAQQAGGDCIPAYRFHSSLTRLVFAVYFTKSSPDFVNHSGRILSSSQQVRALGEAQSIGDPFPAWCLR